MTAIFPRAFSAQITEMLDELSALLLTQDAGAAVQYAVTHLPDLLEADRVFVYQISKDRNRLIVTHESANARTSLLGLTQPIGQLPAISAQAVRTGQQVWIDDLGRFPVTDRQRRSLRFADVVATVMTPFGVERRFAGMLVADVFNRSHTWDHATLEACTRVAGRLGKAIGHSMRGSYLQSESAPAIETKSAQLTVLSTLTQSFANARHVQTVIDAVIDELGMLYGADRITIYTSAENSGREILEAFSTGELLVREDAQGTRYIVPLGIDDEVIGAIDVHASGLLSTDDAQFLQTVARLSGHALAHAERLERMHSESTTDRLTGLFNHRYVMERYEDLFAQAKASRRALSVLLVDVDGLRRVDARLGYGVGDNVLAYVAKQIRSMLPEGALAARYGNDEFMLLLPDTTVDAAARIAKHIVERISEQSPLDLPPTTVSLGVASAPTHTSQADALLDLVEKAVYVAKYGGRNRVHVVRSVNADWERLSMEAIFAVMTAKQFSTGPQAVEKAAERLAQSGSRNLDMALALAQAVDVRDKYTSGHSHAVSNYALKLAKGLNFGAAQLEEVRLGALLHDVGKIGTPEQILGKSGPLTDEEFAIMRNHPEDGARILAPIPSMRRVAAIVEAHQENWNGSGYPFKLCGEEIPKPARIVSIADAYHAMVSTRPYRKGMPMEKACAILSGGGGTQWDPRLVDTFVKLLAGSV